MEDDARKLFIAGLPDAATEDVLRDLFAGAGIEAVAVSIPRDRMTGRPRGFAFVTVGSPDDVERALSELHGHYLSGSSISVRRFNAEPPGRGERSADGGGRPGGPRGRSGPADTSDRTLYVGNLPYDATQEEVEGVLRSAGADAFVRVHLPLDGEGRRRGFGFVTMASADAAKAAVEQLRGTGLRGRPLVVNAAQPKPAGSGGGPRSSESSQGGAPSGGSGGGLPAHRFGPPARPNSRNDFSQRRKRAEGDGPPARNPRGGGRRNQDAWTDDDDE